jgi:tetratricopeptide (TPR) repeat protein
MIPLLLVCALLAADTFPPSALRDEFDEPVTRLVPANPRGEDAQSKVLADALYAHGRLLMQRREFPAALRRLQRAWRYRPEAVSILPKIIRLAHQLDRPDEAARYALLATGPTAVSPGLWRQLAVQLSARQEWPASLALFEASLQAGPRTAKPAGKPDEDLAALLVYLEIGRLALLTQDFAKSADYFGRVREALEQPERLAKNEAVKNALLGQADRTYRLMAEGFYQAGRYDDAEALYRRAYQQSTGKDNPGLLGFYLARLAAKRGRTEAALQHLDTYLSASSSAAGIEPYELLAELMGCAEPDQAAVNAPLQSRLEKLLEADSRNPALLSHLAGLDLHAKRFESAEQRYEQLLVLQPEADVYEALADLYSQQNRPDKLAELCGIAVAKGLNVSELTALLAPVKENAELSSAVVALVRERQQADPQHLAAGALLAAAELAEASPGPEAADALFADGLSRLEPPVRAEYQLGRGLQHLLAGQRARAVPLFRQALTEKLPDERKLACYFYLTRALALEDQPDEALQVANQAAAEFPDAPRLQAQPGWVQYYAKRYEEAERSYLALLARFDDQPAPVVRDSLRDARLVLSNICVQRNRLAQAEEWLEQVLDEFPEDVGALNDLGYLWADQGKYLNRAYEMTSRAVAGEPDNVAYRDSFGWALYRLGRISEAIQELEKAVAGEDPDGVILDHLGDAYLQAERKTEAVATWRRAAAAFAKEGDQDKARATQQKIERCEK